MIEQSTLTKMRLDKNMTLTDVSKLTNLSYVFIMNLERGQADLTRIRIPKLIKLANFYSYSLDDFINLITSIKSKADSGVIFTCEPKIFRLKIHRLNNNLSILDVANALNCKKHTVYSYESYKCKPSNDKIRILAKLYHIPYETLRSEICEDMAMRHTASGRYNYNSKLAEIRYRLGLTSKQAADIAGVSQCTLSKWECGTVSRVTHTVGLDRLLKLYNLTFDEFLECVINNDAAKPVNTKRESALRMHRMQCGLYVSDVANYAGVSKAAIYAVENGRSSLSDHIAKVMSKLYHIPIEQLKAEANVNHSEFVKQNKKLNMRVEKDISYTKDEYNEMLGRIYGKIQSTDFMAIYKKVNSKFNTECIKKVARGKLNNHFIKDISFPNSFLKDLRKNIGFTLNEVADYIGVSEHSISAWELGRFRPNLEEYIEKLADLYEVDKDKLTIEINTYYALRHGISLDTVEDTTTKDILNRIMNANISDKDISMIKVLFSLM